MGGAPGVFRNGGNLFGDGHGVYSSAAAVTSTTGSSLSKVS